MQIQITFGDLLLLTRYALRFEQEKRARKCSDLLARVCEAQSFVHITGRAHPLYGDGSISALAARVGTAQLSSGLNGNDLHAFATALSQVGIVVAALNTSEFSTL